jgi:hypothetical protein
MKESEKHIVTEFIEDLMLEWNDVGIHLTFMKSTARYETEEELNDESIFRLRFNYDYDLLELELKCLGFESISDFCNSDSPILLKKSNLINNCFHSIVSRIKRKYKISVIRSSFYLPSTIKGEMRKGWMDCDLISNQKAISRVVEFKIV